MRSRLLFKIQMTLHPLQDLGTTGERPPDAVVYSVFEVL
jgi:hypothetical protein